MIVGTAGHVDHGKTALVRALTGTDTDRLPEEKARGLSIDLGFAYLARPDGGAGGTIGFVDVPGHERFLRTMLAGAAGIDFALVVVAADDGVMPQTTEHLGIIELLGLARGLVALTKIDVVSPDRCRAATAEIRDALRPTRLAGADILAVSSVTGAGIAELRERLRREAAANAAPRTSGGRFRLAVDRSFALAGIGTVVTGTVLSGTVSVGERVIVSPSGLAARVRSIHAQNEAVAVGRAGERCALNLAGDGIGRDAVRRGDAVLDPGLHRPTARIDAELRLLPETAKPLGSRLAVRLNHRAAEIGAHVVPLAAAIAPGGSGWVQLVLDAPVAAVAGDPFILRDAAARRVLGGGRVADPRAPAPRRRSPERLARLAALAKADPAAALAGIAAAAPGLVELAGFARDRALTDDEAVALADRLGLLRIGGFAVTVERRMALAETTRVALARCHAEDPERAGWAPDRLRLALSPILPERGFAALLEEMIRRGEIAQAGGMVRLPGHRPRFAAAADALYRRIARLLGGERRFRPPRVRDLATMLQVPEAAVSRVLHLAASMGRVEEVAHDHFFLPQTVAEIVAIARILGERAPDGSFAAADLRDRLANGRKVAIQLLEFLDLRGITLRDGDRRRIAPPPARTRTG
ncbi:MAG TPA: selenocysteine-specific translation elongation factor [Stellaceae bacterium]|nr:selenocysteine-specific translation elongation factor [Stellaceae bacterium]